MSMIAYATALTADEERSVRADPAGAAGLIYDEDGGRDEAGRLLDLDKAWHALHFLLTGDPWDTGAPAGAAILGGTPIGDDLGYGPARLLGVADVAATDTALQGVNPGDLQARFATADLDAHEIYPTGSFGPDDWDEYLEPNFAALVEFYRDAAARGDAVLLALT